MNPDQICGGKLLTLLRDTFPELVQSCHSFRGDDTAVVPISGIYAVAQFLKEDPAADCEFLMDLTAVDNLDRGMEKRFEVVYHFYSLSNNLRIRVKVPVNEEEHVPSLAPLWKAADWFEREVWDFYGIRFSGHPNLKRLLLYEEFKGHPLRKDYPVTKRQPLYTPREK